MKDKELASNASRAAGGSLTWATARAQADMWHEANARAAAAEAAVRELLAALIGVIAVADRQTDEFDAARAAIANARGLLARALGTTDHG